MFSRRQFLMTLKVVFMVKSIQIRYLHFNGNLLRNMNSSKLLLTFILKVKLVLLSLWMPHQQILLPLQLFVLYKVCEQRSTSDGIPRWSCTQATMRCRLTTCRADIWFAASALGIRQDESVAVPLLLCRCVASRHTVTQAVATRSLAELDHERQPQLRRCALPSPPLLDTSYLLLAIDTNSCVYMMSIS